MIRKRILRRQPQKNHGFEGRRDVRDAFYRNLEPNLKNPGWGGALFLPKSKMRKYTCRSDRVEAIGWLAAQEALSSTAARLVTQGQCLIEDMYQAAAFPLHAPSRQEPAYELV